MDFLQAESAIIFEPLKTQFANFEGAVAKAFNWVVVELRQRQQRDY
jgi:hypothetical protein